MSESSENKLQNDSVNTEQSGEVLEWSSHPVKRKPILSVGVTLIALLIVYMVYDTMESVWFGLLALTVMYLSLAKFYFPTHYRLSEQGVQIKTTTQTIKKHWKEYRSAYPDKNGILLSPFPEPSRLENFRGLFLIFNNNRDVVVEFVNRHIAKSSDTDKSGEKS